MARSILMGFRDCHQFDIIPVRDNGIGWFSGSGSFQKNIEGFHAQTQGHFISYGGPGNCCDKNCRMHPISNQTPYS